MKTVVHLVPAMEQGGVESVVCDLNKALADAGWKSVVVSRGGRLVQRIESEGGRHIALDLRSKNPLTYFFRAAKLRRTLSTLAVDADALLVCAHSRVPAWLFRWANRSLRLPWITYAHGANSVSRYSAVMTKGDAVIAPSKFLADFLLENYDDPTLPERLGVISPCVDLERFDPSAVDGDLVSSLKKDWSVADGSFVTMSIGRISPVKGFANVMRDFADRRAASDPNARLVIVGGADARHAAHLDELKSLAQSLGVKQRVVFAGAQSAIPECLAVADEVVCGNTEKPESFGLSVCEALAMNKPVRLLRHFGGAAEILDSVAECAAADTRQAVNALYGFSAVTEKTIALYDRLITR